MVGSLDINFLDKVVRFIWFCDLFNILFIIFEDVIGFFLGIK